MKLILRRLRGALGNALVWGVGWFIAGGALVLGTSLFEPRPPVLTAEVVRIVLMGATGIAVAGAITGGVFSAYIAANFRRKRLGEISPLRFALGGSLVTVALALIVIYVGSFFSDWPLFLGDLLEPVLIYGSIGAVTGYGTIKLAQRALPPGETAAALEGGSQQTVPRLGQSG